MIKQNFSKEVMETSELQIVQCSECSDFKAYEDLELQIWKGTSVPSHLISAISKDGGFVLGAWSNQRMIGLALSFVGITNGIAHHNLHQLGAAPSERNQNIALRLMMALKELVIEQGLDLITWTFDPLESVNAHLYLNKVGGIGKSYVPDYYQFPTGINAGLSADRLIIEWHLRSEPRNRAAFSGEVTDIPCLIRSNVGGYPENLTPTAGLTEKIYRIEIPADLQIIKNECLEKAKTWRAHTRTAFISAFKEGFEVSNYFRPTSNRPGCFILERS
jgi:predicted GNAT superfamily acetyltransferase